ncbi:hypothetical protein LZG04_30105 [Saccharothrix sp. S26]|uniref:hypothetical protein n=1 Tax=Saccharothrix sp. S26 TaxID=2907215 RepID=UPI001F16B8EC|nr:hypothetical protein [Saccharothrix sp. S26]MCE6999025.1 hypothetical protein [Saccharothrix sp. S26]
MRRVFAAGWTTLVAGSVIAAADGAGVEIGRFGTKRLIVVGLAVLAGGLGVPATVDADGSFVADVLPGSLGTALVFIPATLSAVGGSRR